MQNDSQFHLNNYFIESPLEYNNLRLIQIGRKYCKSGTKVDLHPHKQWFELTIVLGGSGVVTSNDKKWEVSAGDIYLSLPYELHEIESVDELKYDFYSFFYEDGYLANEFKELMINVQMTDERVIRDEKISYLINNAISELIKKDVYMQNELLCGIFSQVTVYLLRDFKMIENSSIDVSNSQILCYQIMNYIETNIFSITSLKQVSDQFNYNYSYLSTLFKKTTGETIFDYYQKVRLKNALILMSENQKLSKIAEMLNFQDQFSFSKAFKARYKISPKKYLSQEFNKI